MQTIETKIIPATTHFPTRIRATHSGGVEAVTIGLDESDSAIESHKRAAALLLKKLIWQGDMVGGGTKVGMVWVFDEKGSPHITSWTRRKLELA